jgi:hypothetical protein
MDTKYNCDICNYETIISTNYKKHLLSNKHVRRSDKIIKKDINNNIDNTSKEIIKLDNNLFYCKYCDKKYKGKGNKARHLKKCEMEYEEVEQKIKLAEQIEKEKQDKIKQEYDNLLELERKKAEKLRIQEKRDQQKLFQEMIINIVKNISGTNITNNTNNINNISNSNVNNCPNFNYIKKNFLNPLTLEECLNPKLTAIEKENITKSTPTVGCEYIIKARCIDNVDLDQRPIHNIDITRNKFAVYCGKHPNKSWVSKDGNYIISKFIPLVVSQYNEKLKTADGNESLLIAQGLYDLQTTGKKKLVKSISDMTYIKNTLTPNRLDNKAITTDVDSDADVDSDEVNEAHDKVMKHKLDKNKMLQSIMAVFNSMSDTDYNSGNEIDEIDEIDETDETDDYHYHNDNDIIN